ncbi:isopentenyl transferase family protein (plasmid) [Ensifer adhaerens]|uniref:isopentenyl transferase family protein n=1 Tax=Ensifer adhaerens TaxID=106592 RepID=UPI002100FC1A|nr:isopentenyl transferase family protein [Ensifer adhaerens]UTV41916.1 isopentenyl transferase family protein [Ensifer adhaerens]
MQKREIFVILGRTGIGKTDRSVHLAKRYACPVVVLDRIQCHREIGIGSGRPLDAELQGTRRVYLGDRRVADGIIEAEEAANRFVEIVNDIWRGGAKSIVLEGGSISLLQELAYRNDWTDGSIVRVEYIQMKSITAYKDRVAKRVLSMLGSGKELGMLDELISLWPDNRARGVLQSVIGYREIINYCTSNCINPAELCEMACPDWRAILFDCIYQGHLAYAELQQTAMDRILDSGLTTAIK